MFIYESLQNYLKFYKENYFFSPKYKNGIWDGKISFFKRGKCPIGLVPRVIEFANSGNYTYDIDFKLERELNEDALLEFIDSLNLPFEPYDFQIEAFFDCIKKRNHVVISKTGSGKSLVIYMLIRFLLQTKRKVLIILPTVGLITQLVNDFKSYNYENYYDIQTISSGESKVFEKNIVISTWQSIYKETEKNFSYFDAVICDEVHGAKAKSISDILTKMKNAEYRIGTTGTLPKTMSADYFTIVANLGTEKMYRTYDELRDVGVLSPVNVNCVYLNYSYDDRLYASTYFRKNYNEEINWILNNNDRYFKIISLIKSFEKNQNTLILFHRIEQHGKRLLDEFKQKFQDKKIVYVDGSTKKEDREIIRKMAEERNDMLIIASYGVFATGINIKNLHNLVMASSYKSELKVLQGIGRTLRIHNTKQTANIYDIVDNLSYAKEGYKNYVMKHHDERLQYYERENFPVQKIDIEMD